jgi:hypothetical protein
MDKKLDDVLKVYFSELKKHSNNADTTVECEIRLGSYENGKFKAGVTQAFFNACLAMVQTPQSAWRAVEGVSYTLDLFYPTHANNMRCRTRKYDMQPEKKTILKSVQCHHEAVIQHLPTKHTRGGLRMAVATEMTLTDEPSTATVEKARVKELHSFTYTSSHFATSPCLVLDCSRIWSGTTEAEARLAQQQNSDGEGYEIELEVLQPLYILQHPAGTYGGLHGMFLKLLDIYANVHDPHHPDPQTFSVVEGHML